MRVAVRVQGLFCTLPAGLHHTCVITGLSRRLRKDPILKKSGNCCDRTFHDLFPSWKPPKSVCTDKMNKPSQNYFIIARSTTQHDDRLSYEDSEQFGEPLHDVPLFQTTAIPSTLIAKPDGRDTYDVQLHFQSRTELHSLKPPSLPIKPSRPSLKRNHISRSCFSEQSVSSRETVYSRHAKSEPAKASGKGRSCTVCNKTDTPRWRDGPGGRRTLCNVCGLIYVKRQSKGKSPILPGGYSRGTREIMSDDSSRQS